MLVRSRSRNRARGGGSSLDNALLTLASYGATDAWDFVADQYIRAGTVGTSGISVTRASDGYAETSAGVLVNFGSNVLRRTDRGVLIEGARTNLLTYSQEFDNASWSKGAAGTGVAPVVTANQALAPDGTMTADLVVFDRGAGNTSADRSTLSKSNIVTTASAAHTGTIFVKAATLSDVGKEIGFRHVGAGAYTIFTLTENWQRIGVTEVAGGTIRSMEILSRGTQTADNVVSAHFWGAQLEVGAFPSSYVKSEAAAATRAADNLSISDARSAPFTMFAEFEPVGTANQNDIIAYDTLTNGSGIYLTPTPAAWVRESSVTTAIAPGGGAAVVGSVSRVAARFAVNDTLLCNAGTLGSADTSNSPPSTTVLKFAPSIFGGVQSVYLRRVAIIASGATNAQLQAMTT